MMNMMLGCMSGLLKMVVMLERYHWGDVPNYQEHKNPAECTIIISIMLHKRPSTLILYSIYTSDAHFFVIIIQ